MSKVIVISPHQFGLKGSQDLIFVPLVMRKLIATNPGTSIFFLNPNRFALDIPGVIEVPLAGQSIPGADEFRRLYKHLSTNHPDFESFCIERFFMLRWFFDYFEIKEAFTCETDVLVLDELSIPRPRANIAVPFLSEKKCISAGFLSRHFLDVFCEGVLRVYADPDRLKALTDWYAAYRAGNRNGGICDMSFCDFIRTGQHGFEKLEIMDFSEIQRNQLGELECFDSFIGRNAHSGEVRKFAMKESAIAKKLVKDIHFLRGGAYASLEDSEPVRMRSLHCQGAAKDLLGLYYAQAC